MAAMMRPDCRGSEDVSRGCVGIFDDIFGDIFGDVFAGNFNGVVNLDRFPLVLGNPPALLGVLSLEHPSRRELQCIR